MSEEYLRRRVALHDGWTIRRTGGSATPPPSLAAQTDATVPGVVHLDLVRAGVIEHPDRGDGEAGQAWIGRSDWRYVRPPGNEPSVAAVDVDGRDGPREVLELVFESIDTVGRVSLGPKVLGDVENQFHPHRFRVDPAALAAHDLVVDIAAPLDELDRRVERYGDRPVNADGDWGVYSYLRKAACNFGWDWGPKCPTSGLPGPVMLDRWRTARIEAVRPAVGLCNDRLATLRVTVDLVRDDRLGEGPPLAVAGTLAAPDGRVFETSVEVGPGEAHAVLAFEVPEPQRWWPRGRGEPHLHDLRIELRDEASRPIDEDVRRTGLRIVALDDARDPEGARFRVVVNGEAVFCLGANWIPEGLFPGTSSDDVVRARIRQAADAGFNMLRVWGGGTYESEVFHATCDELGMMVWQDFMFACATYPEDEPYPTLIEREVRHQVSRLAAHPSIVLWCGGNENVLAWRNWGWRERMDPEQAWGRRYFTELLPRLAGELDPSRPFLPDSPWSGSVEADPNDPDHGDRHTWDLKVEEVRELVPRFVSEFGHQAPPCRRSIEEAIGADAFADERPESLAAFAGRQRGWGGDEAQYDRWLDEWFTPAVDLDGRLWRMQLLQARATAMSYEWLRFNQPRCGGALIWQLNDAWTGHSWSLIDVHGRPKPSWWAARQACLPRLLGFTVGESGIELAGVNDRRGTWTLEGVVRRVDMFGHDLAATQVRLEVPAATVVTCPLGPDVAIPEDPSGEFLVAELGGRRAFWFYGKDAWLSLPAPEFDLRCRSVEGGVEVEVVAGSLLRDCHLDVHRLAPEITADRNLETLLPGDRWRIRLETTSEITTSDLCRPGVLRTANELGPGGRTVPNPPSEA